MSRLKARLVWIFIMIGICSLPLLIFIIQDSLNMGKTVELNDSVDEYEIARKHPIIASLYSKQYSSYNSSDAPEYNIREDLSLGKNKEKIEKMQSYFSKEINKLLETQVIPYTLIELEEKEIFETDFGYIKDLAEELIDTLYLTQFYRIHTDNDVGTSYEYNQFSKKIISLSIENKAVNKLTDKELQTMCWNMIRYLELDDIDDWHYSENAYESKKAKLIVYCNINKYESFDSLDIGVSLRDTFTNSSRDLVETY